MAQTCGACEREIAFDTINCPRCGATKHYRVNGCTEKITWTLIGFCFGIATTAAAIGLWPGNMVAILIGVLVWISVTIAPSSVGRHQTYWK
jgi:hypothetical protein